MGNIHSFIVNIIIFGMLILCFLMSPFLGKKGFYFGLKLKKEHIEGINFKKIKILYFIIISFGILSFFISANIIKRFLFKFFNVFLCCMFCTIVYFAFKNFVKNHYAINKTTEYAEYNMPKEYSVRTIGVLWYLFYLIPPFISAYFGRGIKYTLFIVAMELGLAFFSIIFRFFVQNYANYTDEDILKDLKLNIYKRKLWNICGYIVLLIASFAIMTVYLENTGIIILYGYFRLLPLISYFLAALTAIAICIIKGHKK